MLTATHTVSGYKATKKDGKLIVHRVPIFCACEREFPTNAGELELITFNDRWIKQAVEHAMAQQRDGYLPSLHIMHHKPGNDVRRAGVFKITGAEPITLKGERKIAIFADLIITDRCAQDEVMTMQLPYRSVEIPDDETAIQSLALLDHEAPFLELPLLEITEVDDQDEGMANATFSRDWSTHSMPGSGPMVAFQRQGSRTRLLFKADADMTKTAEQLESEKGEAAVKAKQAEIQFQDDEKKDKPKDDDKDKNMEDGEGDGESAEAAVKTVLGLIESGMIPQKFMDEILAAIQSQGQEAEEEEPAEQAPAPAPTPGAAMEADPNTIKMAALEGKVEAMEVLNRERDATQERKDNVATAWERLKDRPMGSNYRDKLMVYHEKHGPLAFKAHVDEIVLTFGSVSEDVMTMATTAAAPVPECVAAFAKDGPDAQIQAARFAADWKESQGSGMSVPLERYVANRMKRARA